jgi:hypothetical protein
MQVKEDSKLVNHQGQHQRPTFITVLPTFGMIPVEHHIATLRMANPANARSSIFTVKGEEIATARNMAVEAILRMEFIPEFIFFFGDDMVPEWDALIKLYQEAVQGQWDVLSALYFAKRDDVPFPILWRESKSGFLEEGIDYVLGEAAISDIAGMDFTLIRPEIFHKISKPWFKTGPTAVENGETFWTHTEDAWFSRKAIEEANVRIGVHTGVRVAHLDVQTGELY